MVLLPASQLDGRINPWKSSSAFIRKPTGDSSQSVFLTTYSRRGIHGTNSAQMFKRRWTAISTINQSQIESDYTWFVTRSSPAHETAAWSERSGTYLSSMPGIRLSSHTSSRQPRNSSIWGASSSDRSPDHNPLRIGTLNSILRAVAAAQKIDKKQIMQFL